MIRYCLNVQYNVFSRLYYLVFIDIYYIYIDTTSLSQSDIDAQLEN